MRSSRPATRSAGRIIDRNQNCPAQKLNAGELVEFLCENPESEAAECISTWLNESKRFHAFVVDNRTKIRKKLRTASTPEGQRSVLLELEVAHQLLTDRRFKVVYERYGQGGVRSPDLTLVYRENVIVNVEVTLLQDPGTDASERDEKLINLICHKLGQMMPDNINLLFLAAGQGTLNLKDVNRAMKRLKERVEQRDERLLSGFGFGDPSGFFKQFQWLSGIVVWKNEIEMGKSLWVNPQARRPVPAAVVTLFTHVMSS